MSEPLTPQEKDVVRAVIDGQLRELRCLTEHRGVAEQVRQWEEIKRKLEL